MKYGLLEGRDIDDMRLRPLVCACQRPGYAMCPHTFAISKLLVAEIAIWLVLWLGLRFALHLFRPDVIWHTIKVCAAMGGC